MKTISYDSAYIDYWQKVVNDVTSHCGLRVWEDHFSAITRTGTDEPKLVGGDFDIPIAPGTILPILVSTVINDHALQPSSDLIEVLVGEKSFREALSECSRPPDRAPRREWPGVS
jgi:hypothetical protein